MDLRWKKCSPPLLYIHPTWFFKFQCCCVNLKRRSSVFPNQFSQDILMIAKVYFSSFSNPLNSLCTIFTETPVTFLSAEATLVIAACWSWHGLTKTLIRHYHLNISLHSPPSFHPTFSRNVFNYYSFGRGRQDQPDFQKVSSVFCIDVISRLQGWWCHFSSWLCQSEWLKTPPITLPYSQVRQIVQLLFGSEVPGPVTRPRMTNYLSAYIWAGTFLSTASTRWA